MFKTFTILHGSQMAELEQRVSTFFVQKSAISESLKLVCH